MTHPGVTVVVPVLGRARLLGDLLASLRTALDRYPGPTEVVIADATDGEQACAVRTCVEQHGARLVRAGRGVARQRNAGAAAAQHALVWFVDSDCRATPDALRALVDGLGAAAGAAGRVELSGPTSEWLEAAVATGVVASFDGFGVQAGEPVPWAVTANLLLRRDALRTAGGFTEALPAGEDVDLGLRLPEQVVWVPGAVVEHRTETWQRGGDALRRFLTYGAADAHLLARHPALRGPVEPSVVNALPLALLGALLVTGSVRAAACRTAAWALLSVVAAGVQAELRGPHRGVLSALLVECLHAGRQGEAVRRAAWSTIWCGVVLDPGQRDRERHRRRRTATALVLAAAPTVLRRPA